MQPYIRVQFVRCEQDRSLESTVHRWIARFEAMRYEVARAAVAIEAAKRRTKVSLTLTLSDGQSSIVTTSHTDPYVAVSDAFREARRSFRGCITAKVA